MYRFLLHRKPLLRCRPQGLWTRFPWGEAGQVLSTPVPSQPVPAGFNGSNGLTVGHRPAPQPRALCMRRPPTAEEGQALPGGERWGDKGEEVPGQLRGQSSRRGPQRFPAIGNGRRAPEGATACAESAMERRKRAGATGSTTARHVPASLGTEEDR